MPEMLLRPVGVVRSDVEHPSLVAESGDLQWRPDKARREWRSRISEIVIDSSLTGVLDGIEDFSHLLVVYWAHRVPPEGSSLIKAHPMGRKDLPLVGIFATCSPARPNSICTMVCACSRERTQEARVGWARLQPRNGHQNRQCRLMCLCRR